MLWDSPTDLTSGDKACRWSWDWKLASTGGGRCARTPKDTLPAYPRGVAEQPGKSTQSCASTRFSFLVKAGGEMQSSSTCR